MLQARRLWVQLDFFNLPNSSNRTMTLKSTQPLTELSTRNLTGGVKGGQCIRLTALPPSTSNCLENVGASTFHNPMSPHGPLQG
jgi:hypothetical protein